MVLERKGLFLDQLNLILIPKTDSEAFDGILGYSLPAEIMRIRISIR